MKTIKMCLATIVAVGALSGFFLTEGEALMDPDQCVNGDNCGCFSSGYCAQDWPSGNDCESSGGCL